MPDTKEIIDYTIVTEKYTADLQAKVNKLISKWYTPIWGVSYDVSMGESAQAMVKYKKEEKPITLNADKIKACADEFEKAYLYRV